MPAADVASASGAETEHIQRLAHAATRADDERTRLAATVNLGRMDDSRVLRPLWATLDDESESVRAVAAAALGRLGYPASLPALHEVVDDESDLVRERARASIRALEVEVGARRRASQIVPGGEGDSGAPRLHIMVRSVTDHSDTGSETESSRRARLVRREMERALASDPAVVVGPEAGAEFGLAPHGLDVAIADLATEVRGDHVEITGRLRVAITDYRGRMISFVSGRARVEVPRRGFDRSDLESHRREAMESAARSVPGDVAAHLAGTASP